MSMAGNVAPKILFVDDEIPVLKSLRRFARARSWEANVVTSGQEGLDALSKGHYDIIVSDMRMPEMDGAEFLARVKNEHPDTIRILLTGYSDIHTLELAINNANIFNYLTKPWDELMLSEIIDKAYHFLNSERERKRLEDLTQTQNKKLSKLAVALDREVKERTIEIEQALTLLQDVHRNTTSKFWDTLSVLSQVVDWKDGGDHSHNCFVTQYTAKIGSALGMNSMDLENAKIAASLHHIGTLCLPDGLRAKPRFKLTQGERKLFCEVPVWGAMALSNAKSLHDVSKIIRHHREWVNGKGYPDNLYLDDIPLASRIIHLLSDFHDLCNGRMEEHIYNINDVKDYIQKWRGARYDQLIVDTFWELFDIQDYPGRHTLNIRLKELKPGMILDQHIILSTGMLLLAGGTKIQESHLESLEGYEKRTGEELNIVVKVDESHIH